jgi:hypothetical protein
MGAYTGVFNHPFFAVTNDQGVFEIKNLLRATTSSRPGTRSTAARRRT